MYLNNRSQERGFLMPVAIFIIVIMGGLALTISRFSGQTSIAVVQEAVSVQTFYAAESGAQLAMNKLLYSTTTVIDQTQALLNCTNLITAPSSPLTFTGAGLNNCSTALNCSANIDSGISYFTLTSSATCGSGQISAQRTVEVASYVQ
jgi:MSHA biogenesis protein MshP